MKTYLSVIYLLSISLVISSCTPDYEKLSSEYFTQETLNNSNFNIAFENKGQGNHPDYKLMSQLSASPDDLSVMASIMLINLSDMSITLDYNNFTLETPDGNYSQPTNLTSTLTVPAGDFIKQNLTFKPINNRRLFMKTGKRGDLNRNYDLKVETEAFKLSSSFEISSSDWEDYLNNKSMEKDIIIFNAGIDTDNQQKYQAELGKSDFVHADENEISVAGTNLQFNAFQVKDTFNLHVKIVNHGNDILVVIPDFLKGMLDEGSLLISGDLETTKVEKSKRFIQKYIFLNPKQSKGLSIPKNFLMLPSDTKSITLLADDIQFTKSNL